MNRAEALQSHAVRIGVECQPVRLRGDWIADPVAPPPGHPANDDNVCVFTSQGVTIVIITAYDWHHAGRFGYVHANAAIDATGLGRELERCGCGEWESIRTLTTNWSIVESHLD